MKIFTSKQIVWPGEGEDKIEQYLALAKIIMRRNVISQTNKSLVLSKRSYSVTHCLEIIKVDFNELIVNQDIFTLDINDKDIRSRISRKIIIGN